MTNQAKLKTPGLTDHWRRLSIQWKLLIAIILPLIVVVGILMCCYSVHRPYRL